ncbi:MAG: hypothetical protein IKN30_08815, partial [Synergistaceae bacterium]|nr:hypothetical protein [Synergistaceae bacterium]
SIPVILKRSCKFCVWKKERNTKVPYNPKLWTRAKINVPETFSDYDTALSAFMRGNFDGLGIRIAGKIGAVDLDNCIREDGSLNDTALEILNIFEGIYFEKSPSGKGLHGFFILPDDFVFDKNLYFIKNKGIEIYTAGATNRFMTVMGDIYQKGEIISCPEAVNALLEKFMKRKNKISTDNILISHVSYFTDEEVIELAGKSKQGEKFKALYAGKWEGLYPSQSEADLAFIGILCFWCGCNEGQIERIFRTSGLMRDDKTYRNVGGGELYLERAIKLAVSNCKEVYRPVKKAEAGEDFEDLDDKFKESYKFLDKNIKDFRPEASPRYENFQDGNSLLFVDYYMNIIRFVKEQNCWYFFNGKIWERDITGDILAGLARRFFRIIKDYANTIANKDERIRFLKRVMKLDERKYRDLIIKDARSDSRLHADVSDFDKNIYLLNCPNGTYNLKTKEFTQHNSADFITKITRAEYKADARCERWEKFIYEVMQGNTDLIRFLQTAMGYALSGDTKQECMFMFYGPLSRNGKSTTLDAFINLLGGYAAAMKSETIGIKTFNNSGGPSEDIARLNGVRAAGASEIEQNMGFNAPLIKQMTGNNILTARFLRENSFSFKPQFKLFMDTNYLPVINDETLFRSGRIVVIPFNRYFEESEQDNNLKAFFESPENMSGILNWLIEGFNRYEAEGLQRPEIIKKAIEEYHQKSNNALTFIFQCLKIHQGSTL